MRLVMIKHGSCSLFEEGPMRNITDTWLWFWFLEIEIPNTALWVNCQLAYKYKGRKETALFFGQWIFSPVYDFQFPQPSPLGILVLSFINQERDSISRPRPEINKAPHGSTLDLSPGISELESSEDSAAYASSCGCSFINFPVPMRFSVLWGFKDAGA